MNRSKTRSKSKKAQAIFLVFLGLGFPGLLIYFIATGVASAPLPFGSVSYEQSPVSYVIILVFDALLSALFLLGGGGLWFEHRQRLKRQGKVKK